MGGPSGGGKEEKREKIKGEMAKIKGQLSSNVEI